MAEDNAIEDSGSQEQTGMSFDLHLTSDRMTLYISCVVSQENLQDLTMAVRARLTKMGMGSEALLTKATARLAELVQQGPEIVDAIFLEGRRPMPPKEGYIQWSRPFFETGFEIDPETGLMDYRKPRGQRAVAADEHIATLVFPQPGEDGRDLMGRTIPTGRPKPFKAKAGVNVRMDPADGKFYASRSGRVRFTSGLISIDEVYTIEGSVGLKTGHIKHPGALSVSLNVESESEIEAIGDIEIHGSVENAAITTQGRLIVHGGITGGPKCRIRAAGSVQARYIQLADIEAGGDVVAEREIDQCTIKTQGAVIMAHGRIVGGDITALGGVTTDQIGSEAFLRTTITVGEDYTIRRLIEVKKTEIAAQRENLIRISERLGPLKRMGQSVPPKLRDLLIKLLDEATKANEDIKRLEKEVEDLKTQSETLTKKEIIVRRRILPDVLIRIPPLTLLLKENVEGPIKATIHDNELCIVKTYTK